MKKTLLALVLIFSVFTSTYSQQEGTEKKLGIKELPETLINAVINPGTVRPTCSCEKNIVKDGGFATVLVNGSNISATSPIWKPENASPQWTPVAGCCDSGYVSMWGNQTVGESIRQNGLTIVAGKKYRITFCGRFINQTGPNNPFVRFRFRAFNGSGNNPNAYSSAVGVIGVSTPNITNTTWATYSVPDWTAPANFNSISINPENGNTQNDGAFVSWGQIDNICIQEVSCDCGRWGTTLFSGAGINNQVACGQTIVVKKGAAITINPSYACAGGCQAKYVGTLTSPSGLVQNISSFPFSFTPNELCTYKLTITPICGDKKCGACTITIFSAPGCPGDIVSVPRLTDFDYLDIASYTYENVKMGAFANLEVNAKEELFAGVPNGSYSFSLEKKEVQLISNLNNSLVERYISPSYIPGPGISCQQQEDDQWEVFRRDIAPGLVQRANQTCQAVMYCLQINCNGSPRVFYMMIFKPTSKKCRFIDASLYNQAIFTRNLRAE